MDKLARPCHYVLVFDKSGTALLDRNALGHKHVAGPRTPALNQLIIKIRR